MHRPHTAPTALRSLRSQAGMTLLEIMIVMAIIALVMGFLFGPALMRKFGESKTMLAHATTKKFALEAYTQWQLSNPTKSCPSDLKELTRYMNSDDLNDPFGEPYVMMCGESAAEGSNGFGVMSKGEDKKAGTGDDIKSWEKSPPKAE